MWHDSTIVKCHIPLCLRLCGIRTQAASVLHDGVLESAISLTVEQERRWFQLLQHNMSPVPLVDFRHANKDELPLCPPQKGFRSPVLSVVGSNDEIVDCQAAQETAALYGQGEFLQLPDTAHDIMLVSCSGMPGIDLLLHRNQCRCSKPAASAAMFRFMPQSHCQWCVCSAGPMISLW